jgi:hypothetical protein
MMSIHEYLPAPVKRELKQVSGWTEGVEIAKLARRGSGQEFDCATGSTKLASYRSKNSAER